MRTPIAALAMLLVACGSSSTAPIDLSGSVACGTAPSCGSGEICIILTMDGSAGSSNETITYTCRALDDCSVSACTDSCADTAAANCCPACIADLCPGFPMYGERALECYGY